jgi:hypothetical protein
MDPCTWCNEGKVWDAEKNVQIVCTVCEGTLKYKGKCPMKCDNGIMPCKCGRVSSVKGWLRGIEQD